MLRFIVVAGFALTLLGTRGDTQAGGKKGGHHGLHLALHELRGARDELKNRRHHFGKQRDPALKAVNHAIGQFEAALRGAKDNIKGVAPPKGTYAQYPHLGHMHHALGALQAAVVDLQNPANRFGGHRAAALEAAASAHQHLGVALLSFKK
jgi:hypothetical protein